MFRAHLHKHLSHFLGHRPLKSSKWFTSRFSPSLSISSKPCQEARCPWLFKLSFVHLCARSSFKVAASLLDRNCSLNSGIYFSVRSISFMPARWSSLPSGASVIMFVLKTSSLLTFSLFVVSLHNCWNTNSRVGVEISMGSFWLVWMVGILLKRFQV